MKFAFKLVAISVLCSCALALAAGGDIGGSSGSYGGTSERAEDAVISISKAAIAQKDSLCFLGCSQYRELKAAIGQYEAANPQ